MAVGTRSRDLGTIFPVKYADFSGATGGDREVIAAVSGYQIVVLSYCVGVTIDTTIVWKSAATALSGAMSMLAAGTSTLSSGYHPHGVLETASGEALNITPTGGTAAGHVTYVEIPA